MKPPYFKIVAATIVAASSASAADQTWLDANVDNVWSTSDANWDTGNWANGNNAIFNGTGETITASGTPTFTNLTFNGNYTIGGATALAANGQISVADTKLATMSGAIGGGAVSLTKTGSGTLFLSGKNTYTGGTAVNAGTLQVDAGNYTKDGSGRTNLYAMSVASGATLNLINNAAAGNYGNPACLVIQNLTLSGSGTLATSGTGVTDFWDGGSGVNLTAFTGTFHAQSGTMAFQIDQSRMSGVNAMIIDSGAHLDIRTNGGLTLSSLSGTGAVGSSWSANQVLTVGALNASSQFDGVIQNTVPGHNAGNNPSIALTKIGTGTLTLTNTNTYTGRTTVNGGTLEINGALASGSALTLGGGTLSLTGSGLTQTLAGLTTTAGTGSGILLAANKTLTLGALTSAGANSVVNFNTAAGGADASTSALGTSTVVLTGQTAGNVINKGFTVTDSTGFGLATVDASNNVIRRTTTPLLLASGATSANHYQIDNNGGGGAAAGSSSLAITASQSADSITVDTTANNGVLTLNSGAILSNNTWNFGGVGANTYQITGNAGGASLKSVASGNTITFNNYNTGTVTIASNILANGTNAVIFNGTGTTSLSGVNTYTGGSIVNGGTLRQNLSSRSGTLQIGSVTVNSGAVYELLSGSTTGADTTLFQNNTYSGTGTIRKTGSGYIGIAHTGSNTNNFNGTYNIDAGILGFNSGVQGSGLATININASTAKLDVRTGTVKIDALNGVTGSQVYVSHTTNSILNLGNNNGSGTFNGTIDNGGASRTLALIKNGTGTQTLVGGSSYTGATTVSGGTLKLTDSTNFNSAINNSATVEFNAVAGGRTGGAISGAGTFNKTGAGIFKINGGQAISATGQFNVLEGTLQNDMNAVNWTNNTADINVSSGAILDLFADAIYADVLTGSGYVQNNYGNVSGQSGSAAYIEKLVLGTNNGSGNFSGIIRNNATNAALGTGVGKGGIQLEKIGTGSQTLSGANTYSGGTTLSGGTLVAGHNSALGTGTVTVNGGKLTTGAFTIANNVNITGDSAISGTFSGTTNTGANADRAINTTDGVSFTNLTGQGIFTGGIVSIVGSHTPGNSPGTQTFNTGLNYVTGSSLTLEIAADGLTFDQIFVTNGLTIGANVALTLSLYGAADYASTFWDSNQSFTLISTDTRSGDFLTPTDLLAGDSNEGSWTYGWEGNSYKATWTATAVPEPSAALLGGLGVLFLLRRRRA